mmetsp:Transcript_11287/g.15198  ORF Transcript_11287/g.15198 Transcript_11287/m.15198 type:complete len:192 (-) Transcript_11287:247-822(-)
MKYNALLNQCNQLTCELIDFRKSQTIQVMKDFFVFHYDSKLSLSKLENYTEDMTSEPIALKPGKNKRESFGLACWRKELIVVSGGFKSLAMGMGAHLSSVLAYNILADSWESKPDLNRSRCWHSSCILADKVYVFGGDNKGTARDSIELLDLISSTSRWQIAASSLTTPRERVAVGTINDREIAILGGRSN